MLDVECSELPHVRVVVCRVNQSLVIGLGDMDQKSYPDIFWLNIDIQYISQYVKLNGHRESRLGPPREPVPAVAVPDSGGAILLLI